MYFLKRLAFLVPLLVAGITLSFALTATRLRTMALPGDWVQTVRAECVALCHQADAQWMAASLVALYLFGFLGLRWTMQRRVKMTASHRLRFALPAALVGWAIAHYVTNYPVASRSTDLLVFLAALAIGQGAAFWFAWEVQAGRYFDVPLTWLLRLLAFLLAVAGLLHPNATREFHYRGQARWVGLWENPNTFGVLMAVGVVLAAGLLLACRSGFACSSLAPTGGAGRGEGELPSVAAPSSFRTRWLPWLSAALWLACLVSCATGLLFSYSRCAWLGAALGLAWLGWRTLRGATEPPAPPRPRLLLFRRCAPALALLALSLGVVGFWNFRHTEVPLLRRVFTVGNPNDFSWRNRVATWPGAFEVMARKPLVGWGWNRPLAVYEHGHKPAWLSEGGAISLNDYLMLGMILGVPALWAFLLWIWLVWASPAPSRLDAIPHSLSSICYSLGLLPRAALLPLLLGFALDGGLFKLAVAVPFFVLLELAAAGELR